MEQKSTAKQNLVNTLHFDNRLEFRLTSDEKRRFRAAAYRDGYASVGEWLRALANAQCKRPKKRLCKGPTEGFD